MRIGYNDINKGDEKFETGDKIREKSKMIFGANLNAQLSTFLFNIGRSGVSLIIDGKQYYFINKKQGELFYTVGGGFRLIF